MQLKEQMASFGGCEISSFEQIDDVGVNGAIISFSSPLNAQDAYVSTICSSKILVCDLVSFPFFSISCDKRDA
jgi:hypothetical protein